jgi:putative transposase
MLRREGVVSKRSHMTQSSKSPFDVEKVQEKFKNIKSIDDITGKDGLVQEIVKSTIERLLKAEQEAHLGYEPYKKSDKQSQSNSRNGYSKKIVKTSSGQIDIEVPRDREGSFEPKILEKHRSFDPDLEKRVLGLYAKGMSVRDIGEHLHDFYGTEVSPQLISKITDSVLEKVSEWQSRPLQSVYAVVFMDAIFYKTRQDGKVKTKAAYTCLGIDLEGRSDVLGIWLAESEGAHFWLGVLTELKARGIDDILIACIDGLKGFPDAIEAIYPKTQVQLCIVHQIRNSLKYVGSKNQREFLSDLKTVYRAETLALAEENLQKLEDKWGTKYPIVISSWKNNWPRLSVYFGFPQEIRRMIYTTNIVEGVHRQLRKVTKNKTSFSTDQALTKMLFLAVNQLLRVERKKQHWPQMFSQLRIIFGDRVPLEITL